MFGKIPASAMESIKFKIGVIANNISNSNTIGFKRSEVNFSDMFYQYQQLPTTDESPTGISSGKGVRVTGTSVHHNKQGSLKTTENQMDMAIEGKGFFKFNDPISGQAFYSRNGALKKSDQGQLVNSQGFVLDPPVNFSPEQQFSHISDDGRVWVKQGNNSTLTQIGVLQLSDFPNPAGLQSVGNSLYAETNSSGAVITGQPKTGRLGSILSGSLETSNVHIVKEMMDLITNQRVFDTNHKVIIVQDKTSSNDLIK
jgi:flagellar basal-body rod protein FlgG